MQISFDKENETNKINWIWSISYKINTHLDVQFYYVRLTVTKHGRQIGQSASKITMNKFFHISSGFCFQVQSKSLSDFQ